MSTAPARWSHPLPPPSSVPTGPFRPRPHVLPPDLEADRLARLLKTALEHISAPLARAAAILLEKETWNEYGYARLEDHARERFGRSGRWVRDLAALGRALDRFPELEQALNAGNGGPSIGFVAALHIARIASVDSVAAWIALARTISTRQFKDRIRLAREAGSSWPVETEDHDQAKKDGGMPPGDGDLYPDNGNSSPGDSDSPQKDGHVSPDGGKPGCQADRLDKGGGMIGPPAIHTGSGIETTGERLRVRLLIPRPVRIAFEEGLELCRAVEGRDVPVSDFVDALVAEASTGDFPAEADCLPIFHRKTQAELEEVLEQTTEGWRQLEGTPPEDHSPDGSSDGYGDRSNVLHGATENPDALIRELLVLQERCERQLGRLLARMTDQGAWRRLHFAGLGHYAEQRLGLARTSALERARLARGLRALPVVRQAYDDGRLGSVAALCLVRMLEKEPPDEAIQRDWVERAARGTVKRLRDEHRELNRQQVNERSPRVCRPLTDAEWHRSLYREPGTARARVEQLGRDATVLSFANTIFSVSLPGDLAAAFLSAIESARRSLQDGARAPASDNKDTRASLVIARKLAVHGHEVPAWVGLLALVEEFVATWDVAQNPRRPSEDAVHRRDGWRCMAAGCTSRRNLQEHHVRYRSRGGSDDLDNRLCVCAFHHQRGEHGDLASCRGMAPLGIEWSLGRGGRGGLFKNEIRVADLTGCMPGKNTLRPITGPGPDPS